MWQHGLTHWYPIGSLRNSYNLMTCFILIPMVVSVVRCLASLAMESLGNGNLRGITGCLKSSVGRHTQHGVTTGLASSCQACQMQPCRTCAGMELTQRDETISAASWKTTHSAK